MGGLRESVVAEFKKTGSKGESKVAQHQNIRKSPTTLTGQRGFKSGPECKQATVTFDFSTLILFMTVNTFSSGLRGEHLRMWLKFYVWTPCVTNRAWDAAACGDCILQLFFFHHENTEEHLEAMSCQFLP